MSEDKLSGVRASVLTVLAHCSVLYSMGWWHMYVLVNWVIIGSDNDLALFGTKSFPEPMLIFNELYSQEQTLIKFESKYCNCLSWKYCLLNVVHFILASVILQSPVVGNTKDLVTNFSHGDIFDPSKVPVRSFASGSYLTGVTAAKLQWHLSNMNVIFYR